METSTCNSSLATVPIEASRGKLSNLAATATGPKPLASTTKVAEMSPPNIALQNMQLTGISSHNDHDVLCGRGGGSYKHLGNSTYRHLVNLNKELYLSCKKHEKIKISQAIVSAIRSQNPPGRFLEKESASGLWYDIGDKKAVEKTSQALREGAPKLRQKLTTSGDVINAHGNVDIITAGISDSVKAINAGVHPQLQLPSAGKPERARSKSPPPIPELQPPTIVPPPQAQQPVQPTAQQPLPGSAAQRMPPTTQPMPPAARPIPPATAQFVPPVSQPLAPQQIKQSASTGLDATHLQGQQRPGVLFGAASNQPSNQPDRAQPPLQQQQHMDQSPKQNSYAPESTKDGEKRRRGQSGEDGTSAKAPVESSVPILSPRTCGGISPRMNGTRATAAAAAGVDDNPDMVMSNLLTSSLLTNPQSALTLNSVDGYQPRRSMFRNSTHSVLTDYSDMLDSVNSFDIDQDITVDPDNIMSMPRSSLRTSGRFSLSNFQQPTIRRSVFRGSEHSILTDFSDISEALDTLQMDEEDVDLSQAQDGDRAKRPSVRFSISSKGPQGRRSAFAINEFAMHKGPSSRGISSDCQAASAGLLELDDVDESGNNEHKDHDHNAAQDMEISRHSMKSRSSVRFSLPKSHFDRSHSLLRSSIISEFSASSDIMDELEDGDDGPLMVWDVSGGHAPKRASSIYKS